MPQTGKSSGLPPKDSISSLLRKLYTEDFDLMA
jgi:hypothetical protein